MDFHSFSVCYLLLVALSRRKFIRACAGAAVGGLGLYAYATQIEPHHVEWVHVPMKLPDGTSLLQGQKLIHISDTHIGPIVSKDYLIEVFKQVQTLEPDWVVMTGDFITFVEDFEKNLDDHLQAFPKGKKGTIGILGNHDYSHRFNKTKIADLVASIAEKNGIQILRNERSVLQGIQWIGIDDKWAKKTNLPKSFSPLDPSLQTKTRLIFTTATRRTQRKDKIQFYV